MRFLLVVLLSVILVVITATSLEIKDSRSKESLHAEETSSTSQKNVHRSNIAQDTVTLANDPSSPTTNIFDFASVPIKSTDEYTSAFEKTDIEHEPSEIGSEDVHQRATTVPPQHSSSYSTATVSKDNFSEGINTNNSVSHIEVSGILISIDGVPTTDNTLDSSGKPVIKTSSPKTNGIDEAFSLGPIEISSILHQLLSSSILRNGENATIHINASDVQAKIASSLDTSQRSSATVLSINRDNASEKNDIQVEIHQVSRKSKPELSSLVQEEDRYSIYHGPLETNNPYAHWDSDSEEQEHEMELQRIQEHSKEVLKQDEEDNAAIRISGNAFEKAFRNNIDTSSPSPSNPTTGRSYLLLLAGNSTIVRLRQKDFAKYLKLNLAARLSLEYDDVRVNRVVLAPPQLLVNVSVVTPSESAATIDEDTLEEATLDTVLREEEPLHMLAETNATLLELSGEEYHVVRLLSLRSQPPGKKQEQDDDSLSTPTVIRDSHSDIELIIYTAVGGGCAIVILVTLFITFGRYLRLTDFQWPWHRTKSPYSSWNIPSSHLRHRRMGDEYPTTTTTPPTVIYSGSFAARAGTTAPSTNSWMDECQTQSSVKGVDDAAINGHATMLGAETIKLSTGNPLYTDLELGGASANVIIGQNPTLYPEAVNSQRHQSPSKLHIFSCRPGSIVIPVTVPSPHHQTRINIPENLQPQKQKATNDTHPLDVRIREDSRLGHDNPNYQI